MQTFFCEGGGGGGVGVRKVYYGQCESGECKGFMYLKTLQTLVCGVKIRIL